MRYLFVGAHPDDIELGAGGTIAKSVQLGITCDAIVLSDCSHVPNLNYATQIVEESSGALTQLGIKKENLVFGSFSARNFPQYRQEILQKLVDEYSTYNYSRVFCPSIDDLHQDHSTVGYEVLRFFKYTTVLGFELPWNSLRSAPSYYNVLTQQQLEIKLNALDKFKSQRQRFYMDRETIQSVAAFRGVQAKSSFAEAFEVYKWVDH